nr:hypothetical protein BaRGS_027764 [Batillaria attramentaria]
MAIKDEISKIDKGLLSYCALNFGFSMMSRAFGFYYVKVFLNEYGVKESWFHFSQLLYMVWNAVNDPLFAVLQDNTNFVITRTRREGILYSAPFFALAFMIPWFRFGNSDWAVGIHLIVALCLYDTMFTFVGLLSCCLFTEISADQKVRLRLTRWSTVAGLIGGQSVLLIEFTSSSLHNFRAFQLTNFFIAVCACGLMVYAGIHGETNQVPMGIRSTFYGMTGFLGGLLVIFGAPFVGQLGYFRVIRYNFVWKVFGGLLMYCYGPSNPWLLMLFILLDTSFDSATFNLFNLPVADIVDHDMKKYGRKKPISSTVFGSNALVTKPAQSVAPMVIVAMLNRYGYEQLKAGTLPDVETQAIKDVMFQIICLTPVVLGVVQYVVWSQFSVYRKSSEQTII